MTGTRYHQGPLTVFQWLVVKLTQILQAQSALRQSETRRGFGKEKRKQGTVSGVNALNRCEI
jgi:hypothetical protein